MLETETMYSNGQLAVNTTVLNLSYLEHARRRRWALTAYTIDQRSLMAGDAYKTPIGVVLTQAQVAKAYGVSVARVRAARKLPGADRVAVWNGTKRLIPKARKPILPGAWANASEEERVAAACSAGPAWLARVLAVVSAHH